MTVGRPWGSLAVETTPGGLVEGVDDARLRARQRRHRRQRPRHPRATSRAGSVTTAPSTVTRPSATIRSAARREATPAWARYFASRTATRGYPLRARAATFSPWISRYSTRRSPPAASPPSARARCGRAPRAGCPDYGEMSELPGGAARRAGRARSRSRRWRSSARRGRADGTVKALFATADGRPVEAVLMRYRDSTALDLPVLAVGLPADLHASAPRARCASGAT